MPTYDYRCLACSHEFEAFQRMSDNPLTECPKCKGGLKRLVGGGAGFLFKGSGFYTTDYRSKSYTSQAKSESKSSNGTSESPSKSPPESKASSESKGSGKEKAADA